MTFVRCLVVVVAMLAASCGPGFVPPSPETPPDEAMEVFVGKGGLPGLAVAVIKDRELVYSKVAGVRKRGDVTPVAADDAFHIGSMTKGFTALVAATVVDAGQLTWDAKVGDVLAGVVPVRAEYRAVTLAQLLSHSSGIPEIGGDAELAFDLSTAPTAQQRREIAAATLALNPLWAAGTRFFYSNVNFVVAGLMLEVVTGQSWEVLVTERLFGPLGMTRAGFGLPGTAGQVDAPWGHGPNAKDPGQPDIAPGFGPAGTIHANLGDLVQYVQLYFDHGVGPSGRIVSVEGMAAVETPNFEHYGFGLVTGLRKSGEVMLWHQGSNGYFYAEIVVFPDLGTATIMMTNEGDDPAWTRIHECGAYLGQHFQLPPGFDWAD